jgi:hypothetical protein
MLRLAGLCSGGVLVRPVAHEGTFTSPGSSPLSPLDFLLRRIVSALWWFGALTPARGGNGSVILDKYNYKC